MRVILSHHTATLRKPNGKKKRKNSLVDYLARSNHFFSFLFYIGLPSIPNSHFVVKERAADIVKGSD